MLRAHLKAPNRIRDTASVPAACTAFVCTLFWVPPHTLLVFFADPRLAHHDIHRHHSRQACAAYRGPAASRDHQEYHCQGVVGHAWPQRMQGHAAAVALAGSSTAAAAIQLQHLGLVCGSKPHRPASMPGSSWDVVNPEAAKVSNVWYTHWFAAAYGACTLGWQLMLAAMTTHCFFCHFVVKAVHTPAKVGLRSQVEQPQVCLASREPRPGILHLYLAAG